MTQTRTVLNNSLLLNDKDLQIIEDIFDIIVKKGPISIYKLAKELQANDKYKDISWNALRMKITRIIYRLVLAGMIKYEKGPRNSKLIDLSYDYLYGKYSEIPKDILSRLKIDAEKFKENPIEEIKRILKNTNKKIKDPTLLGIVSNKTSKFRQAIIKYFSDEMLRKILEILEPDLFSGWNKLAEKVKDYYYDALFKREIKRNPHLGVAYYLIKLGDTDNEEFIEHVTSIIKEFYEKICDKYGPAGECPEDFPEIIDKISDGLEDYIGYTEYLDLLISKVILPKLLNSIGFYFFVDGAKALYLVSGNVVKPIDVKDVVEESILLSNDPHYIESLRETVKLILPFVARKIGLIEAELNVYKGLEKALIELLEEINEDK